MKYNYRYIVSISFNSWKYSEVTYSFPDPILSRYSAIQEFKKGTQMAVTQLSNQEPDIIVGIPDLDNPKFIEEVSEFNPIQTGFSFDMILDLDGTQYSLAGQGISETIEALSAEFRQFKMDGLITDDDGIQILENIEYHSTADHGEPPYLLCKNISEVPEFKYMQHSILKYDADYLLSVN